MGQHLKTLDDERGDPAARPRRHGRHRGVRTGPTAPGAARAPGSFLCKSFCAALTLTETRQDLANFGGQRVKTSGKKAAALSRVQPVLAGHPAASADVPGGRLGPHGWGRHRHPVDRDRGAARPPAAHRAEPTTEIDQAHTSAASAAPRSRKPGLAAGRAAGRCRWWPRRGRACLLECQRLLPAGRGAPASAPRMSLRRTRWGEGP